MLVICHGVLLPIGFSKRHDAFTHAFEKTMSGVLKRTNFFSGRDFGKLAVNFAYATGKGTMFRPYYAKIYQHPDGRVLNILIEARTSRARNATPEQFVARAVPHVLDALIHHSTKQGWPTDRLQRSRARRKTSGVPPLFFWEDHHEQLAQGSPVRQARRSSRRKPRGRNR